MKRLLAIVLCFACARVFADALPSSWTCSSPATDYLSCISCAGEFYDRCVAACGIAPSCKWDCSATLRADYRDCQQNFDPLTY